MDILKGFSVIPRNLDMAVDTLITWYKPQLIWRIEKNEINSKDLHHTNGKFIRNVWIYIKNSPLTEWFNNKGIRHPDDMSSIILESTFRKIKDEDIRLNEQIQCIRQFWYDKGLNPDEI